MSRLVDELINSGYLKSASIIEAFSKIKRASFVSHDLREHAEVDMPLPIGYGQTISQPLTVALMLELLDPQSGQNILDVGSGSGWTTALLANIVGEKGRVTGIEIIEELCAFGKGNAQKFGFVKKGIAEFYCVSGAEGFEKYAPYDRILVSAAAMKVPEQLKKQLAMGGKMVIPIKSEIWQLEKVGADDFKIKKHPGFAFVPFVEKK